MKDQRDQGGDLLALMPFATLLGMHVTSATPEEVSGRLPWSERLCTTGGTLHGGAVMSFADSLGAVCAYLNLPHDATTSTIESKINFFRGVRSGWVDGKALPLHVGLMTLVVQTALQDDRGKPVAQVTQTQSVISGSRS